MLHAIDVSHHQNPSAIDWAEIRAEGCDIAIVRLTYGTMIDRRAVQHAERARAAGFALGAYMFFRPSQPIDAQRSAFCEAALLCGYGRPSDIVPALDVEDDTAARPILPEQAPRFEEMARKLRLAFDATPMVYITQRDWGRLGRPPWALDHPLWVAHYAAPSRKEPATPDGRPWCGWQNRVGKFALDGPNGYYNEPGQIDQSKFRELRFIGGNVYVSAEPEDAELSALRAEPDEDGTEAIRARRFASYADEVQAWGRTEAAAFDALRASANAQLHDADPNAEADPDDEITTPDGKGNA